MCAFHFVHQQAVHHSKTQPVLPLNHTELSFNRILVSSIVANIR
nr:MAG TPA: hypothetical protein [Caudoviricetes sp.]